MSVAYERLSMIFKLYESGHEDEIISLLFEDEQVKNRILELKRNGGHIAQLLDEVMPVFSEYVKDVTQEDFERLMDGGHIKSLARFWRLFDLDSQKRLFDDISFFFREPNNDTSIETQANSIKEFWTNTKPEVQKEKYDYFQSVIGVLDDTRLENKEALLDLWRCTNPVAKEIFLPKIFEELSIPASVLKKNEDAIIKFWGSTAPQIQEKFLFYVINSLLIGYDNDIEYFKSKYRPPSGQVYKHGSMIHHKKMLYNLLSATHPTILLKNLMAVLDSIKDREFYEDFVHGFLGNVSIDSNGVITFPDNTIRDALFNGKEKMAKDILDSFARVNNNINAVRFILGLQRAINTIDEGLEFRLNAERIITALAYAQYKGIDSIGLRELLLLRGAEFTLLTDIKYSETHDAMGRAAIIADKKNTSGNVRKYPDFSFEDGEYRFHVYSPREKSGMMLGYETNCCFRPDGHADINKRCKGYSLFDYCNTNPYGGIMDISQMIAGERVTLMGTPFLVNGNMGLFHSFETKMKDGDFSKVNELLIEGARRWIDKDSIDIVMITNFNITQRLDMEDKIILPPTFYPYLEGNASLYNGMYSNIADNSKRRHIVLAARVNGRIISGAELMKWYKEECGENPEVLKQKLNLHGGEIAQDYEFEDRPFRSSMIIGKDQNVPYEIESLSSSGNQTCFGFRNIIEHYYEKYVAFMKEHRDEIELFRAIHEHETNIQAARMKEEPIDSFEQFEIVNLRREIAELIAKRTGTSIPTSKLDAEVRKEEEIIYERLREITSLENPWEFAQVLGISDEVRARIEQRVDQELSSYKNDRAKKVLTSNQKRVQNHLIGMIRRQLAENPYNQALNDLLTQVRNGDLSIISSEETGLTLQLRKPIQNYLGVFCARDDDREFIQNERECSNKTERERRIIAYSGNVDMVETVMAEIMFSDTEMNHREQGVKRVSAKEKFRLFKYAITKGIKDREQMDSIMHSIDRSKPILEHTDELHFGRNWYIAMSRRIHDVSIAFNPNLTEAERDDAIKQMSEVLVEKQKRFTQKHPGRVWRKTNNDSLEEV